MPIGLIVLIIINIILYHALFKVYYFNLGFGLIRELICAAVAAVAEMFLFFWVIDNIGGFLGGALGIIGKILLIVIIIGALYCVGMRIYRAGRNKEDRNEN